jgi:DNA polymerase-3 subunit alpha
MGIYFPVHAHSEFSAIDGMGSVLDMGLTVKDHGQPALSLTDHGNMAGGIQLYEVCKKLDLVPFPGSELYIVRDHDHGVNEIPYLDDKGKEKIRKEKWDNRNDRYHLGVLVLDEIGWKGLVKLSSMSHQRDHFHRKPLIAIYELLEWGETYGDHVAITTGCYFGWVIQHHLQWGRDLDRTTALVERMHATFPHLYVELQNHNIDHPSGECSWCDSTGVDGGEPCKMCTITDTIICEDLLQIAERLDLQVVAGQDSHYCDHDDQPAHDMMKKIAYHGGNGEDSKFPGDGFHLADDEWMREHHADWWDKAMAGHDDLLDRNDLTLPALDNYHFRVPTMEGTKLDVLITQHETRSWLLLDPIYEARTNYELGIIRQMGFEGYFQIVADFCTWCRKEGIFINARGSANGSLVCYLAGITNVDPIVWDVEFERFLSLDRQKPPDVDMDIESERRDDVIGYVRTRLGELVQIGTWNRLGISDDEEDSQKGSLFVQWHAAARSRGEDGDIPQEDLEQLRVLSTMDIRKSYGAHAGGFVVAGDDLAIEDMLATQLIASSNTTVTQAPMDDVENCGYVKFDFLGLRSLTTVRRCMELIGKDPVKDGWDWIPNDDRRSCVLLRSGIADNGIFQFEGYSTARGSKIMKVKSTDDARHALALFRPALMNGGQTDRYLERRASGDREHIHEAVDDLFDGTHGVPVWQEQVLALMKRVGLSADDRNAILKAVKMSNDRIAIAMKTFKRVHPIFVQCAMDNLQVSEQDGEAMWRTVMEFTDYGFNKAHATAYGLMGYRMAYLKANYPTEFMAALLDTWAGTDKEPQYVREAHRLSMTIHKPNVNVSKAGWIAESKGHLRRGFRSIKGIGPEGARALEECQPYESITDLCERVPGKAVPGSKKYLKEEGMSSALLALYESGALDAIMKETDAHP